jgi:metallo-beta-lactamase class B
MKKFLIILLASFIQYFVYAQGENSKIVLSKDLELIKLTEHAYVHVSYDVIPPWGLVASNGMVLIDHGQAFLFDTPTTDSLTKSLVTWIQDSMHLSIVGFIPNHWHNDCMGGLGYLHSIGVESYANQKTIDIANSKNLPVPKHGFKDSIVLQVGDRQIDCYYLGAGHTSDNIVVWIPSEKILFGGCMVKEMKSQGMGNLADADISQWPVTINKVLHKFSDAKFVIPGHGQFGGLELIKHTEELLNKRN